MDKLDKITPHNSSYIQFINFFFLKKKEKTTTKVKLKRYIKDGEDEPSIEHGNTQVLDHAAMEEQEEEKRN